MVLSEGLGEEVLLPEEHEADVVLARQLPHPGRDRLVDEDDDVDALRRGVLTQ